MKLKVKCLTAVYINVASMLTVLLNIWSLTQITVYQWILYKCIKLYTENKTKYFNIGQQ